MKQRVVVWGELVVVEVQQSSKTVWTRSRKSCE